jgi:hypothetical protein
MLGSWINQQGFKSDVVSVTGAQIKEHKFHHINLFEATNLPNLPGLETINDVTQPFNPQILTATSGAANAGLDSEDVFGVGRAEFPTTLADVLQEKGGAGRRPNASAATDGYLVCLSLETYVYLLHRKFKLERSGATWKRKTEHRATPPRKEDTEFFLGVEASCKIRTIYIL